VAAPALDPAVAGTIGWCNGVVETFNERAEELEILQALNIFLFLLPVDSCGECDGPVRAAARMAEKEPNAATGPLYS
jgi:hypothetical protein